MNRAPTNILRVIGWVAIVCAVLGLNFNRNTLMVILSGAFAAEKYRNDGSHFFPAFYVMSAICIACYALLAWYGVQFIGGRAAHLKGFTALMIFECAYFAISVWLEWLAPNVSGGTVLAVIMANGALKFQFVILFPLWAPFVTSRAVGRLRLSSPGRTPMPS